MGWAAVKAIYKIRWQPVNILWYLTKILLKKSCNIKLYHWVGTGNPMAEKVREYKTIILGGWACSKKVGCKVDEYVEDLYGQPAKGKHSNDGDQHPQNLQRNYFKLYESFFVDSSKNIGCYTLFYLIFVHFIKLFFFLPTL